MSIYYVYSITKQYNVHVNTGTYMIDSSISACLSVTTIDDAVDQMHKFVALLHGTSGRYFEHLL